ncbi:MAG TPA: phosphate ABC transporter permease PstA [Anaerovoracaceae bacterium]|nr:phosphate ABC transporter permease PstA [Anaerovoracaceae bacterium]
MNAETIGINNRTFKNKLKEYKKSPLSLFLALLTVLGALITVGLLLLIIIYIMVKGVPYLNLNMFAWDYSTNNLSMMPAIVNTLLMVFWALLISVPFGIGSAIYLVEYAKKGNRLVGIIRLTTETLQGIPSIVYGLFGFLLFVMTLGWSYSLMAGAFTLAIMCLPLIMRSTEEALKAVPDSYREGSYGLGAGKLRTVIRIVLPSAARGILAGIILSVGRIVGETAALIYTAGTVTGQAFNPMDSGRTLSIHMYALINEGIYVDAAFATSVVLLIMVLLINAVSTFIAGKFAKNTK